MRSRLSWLGKAELLPAHARYGGLLCGGCKRSGVRLYRGRYSMDIAGPMNCAECLLVFGAEPNPWPLVHDEEWYSTFKDYLPLILDEAGQPLFLADWEGGKREIDVALWLWMPQ